MGQVDHGPADPFEAASWRLPPLAEELEQLVCALPRRSRADEAADWAVRVHAEGSPVRAICEAAMWVGLRNTRAEGRGPHGLVSHAVLAADSAARIGHDQRSAVLAAAQLCAYTAGDHRGGANDVKEGPTRLGWFAPAREHPGPTDSAGDDPADATDLAAELLDAAARGEVELSDHLWLAAVETDPVAAEHALLSAAAAGYHLNEHKLIHPAQLLGWARPDGSPDPVLFRAAARYAGNHLQDGDRAAERRADAAALAELCREEGADDGAQGALPLGGDDERVSVVATGIARTAAADLAPLVIGSLQDGLAPGDLIAAVALVDAARYADTSFDPGDVGAPVGPVHANTGINALRRCLGRARTRELAFELALCATESPNAAGLVCVAELSVPPWDDGALDDLLDALTEGDPDAAAEAASAVPVQDGHACRSAWAAIVDAAVTDQWMVLHALKHVVALRDDFDSSTHPARAWFLAAAARTAAHARAVEQPLAQRIERRLG